MAGFVGNSAWWLFQKQSAKGTPGTIALPTSVRTPFTGGSFGPTRDIGQLAETDAERDQGISYVKSDGVKGSPEMYARSQSVASALFAVLGSDTVTTPAEIETLEGKVKAATPTILEATTAFPLAEFGVGTEFPTQAKTGTIANGTFVTAINEATKEVTLSNPVTGGEFVAGKIKFFPPSKHVLVPANTLPYWTVWSALTGFPAGGEALYEKHTDCIISDANFKTTAGSPVTIGLTALGVESKRETSDPNAAAKVALQNGVVYNYNNATVTLSSVATKLIAGMDLAIGNNATAQQTDDVFPLDIALGKRTVSIGFDLIFADLKEYNKFHYGTEAGTTLSPNLYTTNLKYEYKLDAANILEIEVPVFAYEEFPLAPEVQGQPLVVSLKGVAQRNAAGVIKATVTTPHRAF